jgi:predicted DCC family thiol-disulfide oxidoreductase YuxK
MSSFYLLYDDQCPLCVGFQQRIRRWDTRHRIEPVGFDDPRTASLVPQMTRAELENSFHLVFPDGKMLSGAKAFPDLLELLPRWKWLGRLLKIMPGSGIVSEWIYGKIAASRRRNS